MGVQWNVANVLNSYYTLNDALSFDIESAELSEEIQILRKRIKKKNKECDCHAVLQCIRKIIIF